jgi:hypothetical protein
MSSKSCEIANCILLDAFTGDVGTVSKAAEAGQTWPLRQPVRIDNALRVNPHSPWSFSPKHLSRHQNDSGVQRFQEDTMSVR